jgi:hypothetical protein
MERLGERLARELWYGFAAKNLRRMVQFAQAFADAEIVASLMRQLSWTHVLQFLPFKTEPARRYSNAGCQRQETVQKPAPQDFGMSVWISATADLGPLAGLGRQCAGQQPFRWKPRGRSAYQSGEFTHPTLHSLMTILLVMAAY